MHRRQHRLAIDGNRHGHSLEHEHVHGRHVDRRGGHAAIGQRRCRQRRLHFPYERHYRNGTLVYNLPDADLRRGHQRSRILGAPKRNIDADRLQTPIAAPPRSAAARSNWARERLIKTVRSPATSPTMAFWCSIILESNLRRRHQRFRRGDQERPGHAYARRGQYLYRGDPTQRRQPAIGQPVCSKTARSRSDSSPRWFRRRSRQHVNIGGLAGSGGISLTDSFSGAVALTVSNSGPNTVLRASFRGLVRSRRPVPTR